MSTCQYVPGCNRQATRRTGSQCEAGHVHVYDMCEWHQTQVWAGHPVRCSEKNGEGRLSCRLPVRILEAITL